MSKKRLDRTVIEGGRGQGNKNDRYQSNSEVRQSERDFLKAVTIDPSIADDQDIDTRTRVGKEFRDKLSPMYKWLATKVDLPWSDVRKEVFEKFDTKTIAGSHITFDHLLSSVVETISGFDKRGEMINPNILLSEKKDKTFSFYRHRFYVDENDILRKAEGESYKTWAKNYYATKEDYLTAEQWLNSRASCKMVMEKGGKLFWLYPSQDVWRCSWFEPPSFKEFPPKDPIKLQYFVQQTGNHKKKIVSEFGTYEIGTSGDYWMVIDQPYGYKQRGEMHEKDAKMFRSFKETIRKDILVYSKGRK